MQVLGPAWPLRRSSLGLGSRELRPLVFPWWMGTGVAGLHGSR